MLRLYSNGVVHGLFEEDHIECLLSPNGTYFLARCEPDGFRDKHHDCYPNTFFSMMQGDWWKQRTLFCLSFYQKYVADMLKFRNMYSANPYVDIDWLKQLYPILVVRFYF
jgi:hypothetical protein